MTNKLMTKTVVHNHRPTNKDSSAVQPSAIHTYSLLRRDAMSVLHVIIIYLYVPVTQWPSGKRIGLAIM